MRRAVLVVAAVSLAVGCADGAQPSTTSGSVEADTTTPAPTTAPAIPEDTAALCNGYLVLLRTGDDVPLRDALDDPDLVDALDRTLSSEGEFEAIAQASRDLEEAILDRCADRYAANLEPASDDATALTMLMEAILAGDREAAEAVAWDNVVAQLEPWSPVSSPGTGDTPGYTVDGSTATAVLGPAVTLSCRADGGVVVACAYGE